MLGGCRWKPLVMEMVTDINSEVMQKAAVRRLFLYLRIIEPGFFLVTFGGHIYCFAGYRYRAQLLVMKR